MKNRAALSTDFNKLRGITFGALNIRSLTRKIDEIKIFLSESEIDYFSLTETWLNNSISDCEIDIPHYNLVCSDRDLGSGRRSGGGMVTYLHDKYDFQPQPQWNLCCPDMEWTWSILKSSRTRDTYICNLYRPPQGNIDTAIALIESKLTDIY